MHRYVADVDAAGDAYPSVYIIALETRVLDGLHKGVTAPGLYSPADIEDFETYLDSTISAFESSHEGVYLGFNEVRR